MRQAENGSQLCIADGCNRLARHGGRCWGHKKRRLREMKRQRKKWKGDVDPDEVPHSNKPLRSYGELPQERLRQAAIAYADAESDADFERRYDLLRKAALRYASLLDRRKPGARQLAAR